MVQGRPPPLSMRQHPLLLEAASVQGHRSVAGLSSVVGRREEGLALDSADFSPMTRGHAVFDLSSVPYRTADSQGGPAFQEPSWSLSWTSHPGLQPMTCGVCLPRDPKTFSPECLHCLVHTVLYEGVGHEWAPPSYREKGSEGLSNCPHACRYKRWRQIGTQVCLPGCALTIKTQRCGTSGRWLHLSELFFHGQNGGDNNSTYLLGGS